MARPAKKPTEAEIETNVVPILSIMFLLVPALLLAMEAARFAAIDVSPPRMCGFPSAGTKTTDPLNLKVLIRDDGYRITGASQQLGSRRGEAIDGETPTIPLARPGTREDFERYDYARLERLAAELKRSFPHESKVTVSAEGDIPYQVLTRTLDALRGRECRLVAGQAPPPECSFSEPIITS